MYLLFVQRAFKNSKFYKHELYEFISAFATEKFDSFFKANFSLDNTYKGPNILPIATEDLHALKMFLVNSCP